jgi:serine/threonine protein kinase/Tfp pilus assembly protein PilF
MSVPIQCPACHFDNPDNTNFCGKCSVSLRDGKTRGEGGTETLVEPRPTALKTGSLVAGRYEIIELLGRGGMGKVYKAHDLDIDEDVALKVIRRDIADNPQIIQRFQNELKLARQISHRNVCRMFDLGKDGATQFITMEYVPGEDLKTTVHRMGPMTIPKALDIGKQICQGLSEAHGLGVIHRDLKPSNIIVDREGIVRIMDFGIAVSPKTKGLTDPEGAPGTVEYLAPELLNGKTPGPASDIYSLGVILYEIVTGKLPYPGDSTYAVAVKHLTGTPKDPAGLNPHVPPPLSRVILKCLAKDPAKRFREASEVCAELGRIEETLPSGNGGNWIKRLWAKIRSERKLKWGLAAGGLLAVAAISIVVVIPIIEGLINPTPDENSLIVLPFRNLNMPEDSVWPQALFQIIQGLETSDLKIVPYEVAVQYKATPLSDADIAKKHKVNNILKGTLALKDGKIVFEVELRRIKPDGILLSRSFSSQSEKDYSAALNAIATMTAEKLGVKLTAPRIPPTPKDPEANQYYSYGLMIYRDRYVKTEKPEDFEIILTNFQKALKLEPTSAIVCWQLGMLYEGRFNGPQKQPGDEKLMMQYLRQAYELDPGLAESNMAMGWYYFNREDHDRAYSFFKKALELDRESADVHLHIGSFLRSLGLYEQALRHYLRALLVAPTPADFAVWHQLPADCYSKLGDVPRSANLLRTAIEVSPDGELILDYALCLITMKEFAEAEKQIKAAHDLGADGAHVRRLRTLFYAATGQREAALELMKLETSPSHPLVTSADALLGLRDEAIREIESGRGEKGFRENRWYRYTYLVLLNNTFFDKLRDEPAFQTMLQKEKALFEDRVKKFGDL